MKLYKFSYTATLAVPSHVQERDIKHLGLAIANHLQSVNNHNILLDGHKTELEILSETTTS